MPQATGAAVWQRRLFGIELPRMDVANPGAIQLEHASERALEHGIWQAAQVEAAGERDPHSPHIQRRHGKLHEAPGGRHSLRTNRPAGIAVAGIANWKDARAVAIAELLEDRKSPARIFPQ